MTELERLARRFEPALRRAFLAAVEAAKGLIPLGVLADAVAEGMPAVMRVLQSVSVPPDTVVSVLADAAIASAAAAARNIRFVFNLPDPLARDLVWQTVEREGWLRFGTDPEWRRSAEQIIRQAFMEGGHPYETARVIREGLGLNAQQMETLARFQAGLDMPADAAARMVERRAAQMVRSRAETIARTETLRAAREGRQETWREAFDEGILDRDRTFKEWIPAGDACDICAELAAMGPIPWDQSFGVDEGSAHPNCRCSIGLVFDYEKARFIKPLGDFPNWDACVQVMSRRLGSKDAAERYCGKLESLIG